jgi:hypothetical protein
VTFCGFRRNEPAAGPTIEGLGERRSFVADVACGAVLVGEGYVKDEELVPDGVVRLSYAIDQWFRTRFTLGVASPWRRSGTVLEHTDMSKVEDVDGQQVSWVDPRQWLQRLTNAREMFAAAERAEAERQWNRQLEVWATMDDYEGHGVQLGPAETEYICYYCDGIGTVYTGGGFESYTYSVRTDPTSPPSIETGSRWVSGQ